MYLEELFNGFKLYRGNCLDILPSISNVDFFVTSPPYFNAREYSLWDSYEDYLSFVLDFLKACYRSLKPSGRIAINIPDGYGRNPYLPIYADYCNLLQEVGFILRGNIIWHKETGGGKTSWGSWCSSSNPCIIDEHEMITVAHKKDPKIENPCKIEKEDFFKYIHSVWHFRPETNISEHPAPYPVDLPKSLINFLTGENALVVDPFLGSGTTAIACHETGRRFIGIEQNKEYFSFALKRIKRTVYQKKRF